MAETKNDARLNFRLTGELKKTIEAAASEMGQSVSDSSTQVNTVQYFITVMLVSVAAFVTYK